jgi:hypothetical protein
VAPPSWRQPPASSTSEFDQEAFPEGRHTPAYFGSAIDNPGVQQVLGALPSLASNGAHRRARQWRGLTVAGARRATRGLAIRPQDAEADAAESGAAVASDCFIWMRRSSTNCSTQPAAGLSVASVDGVARALPEDWQ